MKIMKEKYIKAAQEACTYVLELCPLGSSNRHNGKEYHTLSLANAALVEAKKDFYEHVAKIQAEVDCPDDQNLAIIKLLACIAETAKAGNCQEMAAAAFLFLMEKAIAPIELVSIPTHTFIVIGRNPESPITNPTLWNNDAVICDPWRRQHKYTGGTLHYKESMVYPPSRLLKKLEEQDCAAIAIGYAIPGEPTVDLLSTPGHMTHAEQVIGISN